MALKYVEIQTCFEQFRAVQDGSGSDFGGLVSWYPRSIPPGGWYFAGEFSPIVAAI